MSLVLRVRNRPRKEPGGPRRRAPGLNGHETRGPCADLVQQFRVLVPGLARLESRFFQQVAARVANEGRSRKRDRDGSALAGHDFIAESLAQTSPVELRLRT